MPGRLHEATCGKDIRSNGHVTGCIRISKPEREESASLPELNFADGHHGSDVVGPESLVGPITGQNLSRESRSI